MTSNLQGCRMHGSHTRAAGFSLIEIMIVVTIIGILSAIALPAYNDHTRKTRRAAGASCVTAAAQQMERFYTTALRYDSTGSPTVAQLQAICEPSTLEFYNMGLANAERTYTVTGTPTGKQSGDSCGALSITNTGLKSPSTAGCW